MRADYYRTFLLCTFSIALAFAMRNASTILKFVMYLILPFHNCVLM